MEGPNPSIISFRRANYKKTLTTADGRKKREDTSIRIRKEKRLANLKKKRVRGKVAVKEVLPPPSLGVEGGADGSGNPSMDDTVPLGMGTSLGTDTSLDMDASIVKWVGDAVAAIRSADPGERKEGLTTIRKLISLDDEEMIPFELILSTGIVMDATAFLDDTDPEVVYQTIWFFTNIASSSYTSAIVEFEGLFERIIMFLQHGDSRVRDQAVWCVANVVGDCVEYRDMFYAKDEHMAAFMFAFEHIEDTEHLNNIAWLVQNLCLGNPRPPVDIVTTFLIPVIGNLLFEDVTEGKLRENHEVVNCGIYSLKLLTDKQDEHIQVILDHGILPTVISFLNHPSASVVLGVCQILSNVASGTTEQTVHVRDNELWNILFGIMHFKFSAKVKADIAKEICFFMSNVVIDLASGDPLYGHPIFQHLISLVPGASSKVVQEASFLAFNLVEQGGDEIVHNLLENGLLGAVKKMIESPITESRHNGLVILKNLCKSQKGIPSAAEALRIDTKLEELDGCVDERSQSLVNVILGVYLDKEDEEDGEW